MARSFAGGCSFKNYQIVFKVVVSALHLAPVVYDLQFFHILASTRYDQSFFFFF